MIDKQYTLFPNKDTNNKSTVSNNLLNLHPEILYLTTINQNLKIILVLP